MIDPSTQRNTAKIRNPIRLNKRNLDNILLICLLEDSRLCTWTEDK